MELIHIFDLMIMIAYFAIPIELAYFTYRLPLQDWKSQCVCILFCLFISLCGLTHLLHILQFTTGSLVVYCMTATVSIITAVSLIFVIPHVLALPSKLEEVRRRGKMHDNYLRFVSLLSAHTIKQPDPFLLVVASVILRDMFPRKTVKILSVDDTLEDVAMVMRDESHLLVIDAVLYEEHCWLFCEIAKYAALLAAPCRPLRGVDRDAGSKPELSGGRTSNGSRTDQLTGRYSIGSFNMV